MRFLTLLCLMLSMQAWGVDRPQVVKIALSSAPSNLDPFFSTDANSQNINRLVHKSLIDFSKDMTFECVLCESFEESFRGDKHVLTFKLKKGIRFWDGSKVNAESVKTSVEAFQDEEQIKSIFRFAFKKIEEVKVIDPYMVELVFPSFSLENLSNLPLLKIMKVVPHKGQGQKYQIIGCGDYKVEKSDPLEIVLLPTNDNAKKELVFKVVKDETTLALKILRAEVDLSLANMSPRKIEWLKKSASNKMKVWARESSNYQYMAINHRSELLKDINIRKALQLLIPRKDLLQYKLKDTALLSNSFFSPAFSSFYNSDNEITYNPDLAASYLSKAGYEKTKDGWFKNGTPLTLDWKVSNNKSSIEVAETIKSFLSKNGIKVSLIIQEWGTFMRGVKKGQFDIFIGRWIGFTGPDILNYVFHSKSVPPKGANRGYFINSSFDNFIDQATIERDASKRRDLYLQAQKIANDSVAYINLWHPKIIWMGRNCIEGLNLYPNGSFQALAEMNFNCEM